MNGIIIPKGYKSALSVYETQTAIGTLKREFEDRLASSLNLKRVSAPLFVRAGTGINDDLNGVERPVEFEIAGAGAAVQIVHSLAKWKRMALATYGFSAGEGIYTDMNAVRRDETPDNLHSVYVDQWDWEKVITIQQRSLEYLQATVECIVEAVCNTQRRLCQQYPALTETLSRNVTFITSQELEDKYPSLTPKQRENELLRSCGTAFIMQIGGNLRSGKPHDGRAPDYDDWALNGDILFWHEPLSCAMEISSMGIRVDAAALEAQLAASGQQSRRGLLFHKALLEGELPLTMGGGIGQSRLSMLLLEKAHIGEVQSSVWDAQTAAAFKNAGIMLL